MRKKPLLLLVLVLLLTLVTQSSISTLTTTSLEYVLSQRRSVRKWSEKSISDNLMRMVCKNAFSSAFNLDGMILYCANSTACYRYNRSNDSFTPQVHGDIRSQLASDLTMWGQKYVENAPSIIVIVWDNQKEPSRTMASRKSGIIIQNLYLIAIRHNLGGVCVGDYIHHNDVTVNLQAHLGLTSNLKPMYFFPIGYLPLGESYPTGSLGTTLGNLPSPIESSEDILDLFNQKKDLVTAWKNTSLSEQKLSNLLWSMYGYSLFPEYGHRTTPSAGGEYPFQIYLCNSSGTYNYTAKVHSLNKIHSIDKRSAIASDAGAPSYMKNAPALLILCWNSQAGKQNASDFDSGGKFINTDVGCCLQNVYLSANEWGVAISETIYTTNYDALRKDIADSLPSHIYPMYLVGAGDYPPTYLTLTCHTVDSKGLNIKTHVELWNQTGSLTAESDTNESGWCTFWGPDTRNYTIKVTFQGIPVNSTTVSLNKNVTITLYCQIYYLTVTVNDQYNKAINQAEVTVHWTNDTVIETLRTDGNGLVTFRQLSIGSYIVTSKYGEQSSSQKVSLDKDKTISIQITFPTPTLPTPTPTPPGFPTAQLSTLILLILLAGLTITYIIYRRFRTK